MNNLWLAAKNLALKTKVLGGSHRPAGSGRPLAAFVGHFNGENGRVVHDRNKFKVQLALCGRPQCVEPLDQDVVGAGFLQDVQIAEDLISHRPPLLLAANAGQWLAPLPIHHPRTVLRRPVPGLDSNELSKTYSTLAVDRFLTHLKNHGIQTSQIVITTDLGTENDGDTTHYQVGGFHWTIEQKHHAQHRFNPPACPNANADVESVHSTIEAELFDAQVFSSKADFFAKTATYQLWYNAARKNSSRAYKSPADLLALKAPQISPTIFLLHPIPLESLLHQQGGHDVPGRPV